MTCVVGLIENDSIYMGGDSCAADSTEYFISNTDKVFIKDDMIFGCAGSFRIIDVLKYNLNIPKRAKNISSDLHYLVNKFIPSIIKSYEKNKCLKCDEAGRAFGDGVLLGYKNKLYSIEEDFQVNAISENYYSIGGGSAHAMGSMFSLSKIKNFSPEKKIELSLMAAEKHCLAVRGPFTICKM